MPYGDGHKDDNESMVIVWDGPRPRLMRKLKMGEVVPEPDFTAAASRAMSTALRLGLPAASESSPRKPGGQSPRSSPRTTRSSTSGAASARGATVGTSSSSPRSARASPRAAISGQREPWLAEDDFLDYMSHKVSEVQQHMTKHSAREQARKAGLTQLSTTWYRPALSVDLPRLHMQTQRVALEGVLLDKLPPGGVYEYVKEVAHPYATEPLTEPADDEQPVEAVAEKKAVDERLRLSSARGKAW